MADVSESNLPAVAQYNFKGKNNDELSFRKNDVIAVIQRLDGGWWEGSLNGKIGWFPSNFVRPLSAEAPSESQRPTDGEVERQRAAYRKEIIEDHLKEERRHIELLDTLNERYSRCVADSKLVGADELLVLRSNINEILGLIRRLHTRVADEFKLPTAQQTFGKVFLDAANEFYPLLKLYCENHCIAVELINVKRSELEGALTASGLDIKFWVAGLSTVYRHVEKYATTLQEIERTTAETHADRGNLQRSYAVYRDLYNYCEFVRRQKESQMEFLASGALAPFGADWADALGRCAHVAKVGVSPSRSSLPAAILLDEAVIRCIAVFAKSILLFEPLIASGGGYALRNRLACADLQVAKESAQCMLCFRKGTKNLLVIRALTNEDFRRLCDALVECDGVTFERQPLELEPAAEEFPRNGAAAENIYVNAAPTAVAPSLTQSAGPAFDSADSGLIPGGGGFLRRNRDRHGGSMRATKKNDLPATATLANGLVVNHELEMIMPEGLFGETHQPAAGSPGRHRGTSAGRHGAVAAATAGGPAPPYSGWCIRPLAAPRGDYLTASAVKLRKGLSAEEQEDAEMLRIVEGYCSGGGGGASGPLIAPHRHLYHHGASQAISSIVGGAASRRNSGAPLPGGPVRRAASYPDEVVVGVSARPQLIVAENEKLFVEEMEGDQVVVKERSLVDTVYALKDQMTLLQKELSQLSKNFEQEQRARRRFEDSLRRSSAQLSHSATPKPLDAHKFGAATPSDD